jgi:hypothetical protein
LPLYSLGRFEPHRFAPQIERQPHLWGYRRGRAPAVLIGGHLRAGLTASVGSRLGLELPRHGFVDLATLRPLVAPSPMLMRLLVAKNRLGREQPLPTSDCQSLNLFRLVPASILATLKTDNTALTRRANGSVATVFGAGVERLSQLPLTGLRTGS